MRGKKRRKIREKKERDVRKKRETVDLFFVWWEDSGENRQGRKEIDEECR